MYFVMEYVQSWLKNLDLLFPNWKRVGLVVILFELASPRPPFAPIHCKYPFLIGNYQSIEENLLFCISRVFATSARLCVFFGGRSQGTLTAHLCTKSITRVRLANAKNKQSCSFLVIRNGSERPIRCRKPSSMERGKSKSI